MAIDLDEVFAYKTVKVVKMLDRRLGFVFYGIESLIILYIILFVFVINEAYYEVEQSIGQVNIVVRGATFGKFDGTNVPFDAIDLKQPAVENGATFIITKIEAIKQTRDECTNSEYSCSTASDCPIIDGISTQKCSKGFCVMSGWCPELTPDHQELKTIRMEHVEDIILWFRSAITFPGIAPNSSFSSMNREEPTFAEDNGSTDAWTLKELLDQAEAPVEAVKEDGAMLSIRLEWDCVVDKIGGCKSPTGQVRRLDEGKVRGFNYYSPEYVHDQTLNFGADTRILYKYTGVRILVSSKGFGKKFSIMATILQFSSGLALLSVAKIVTDFLLLFVLPEKEHYRRYKEEETPDFSDLRDKIVETEGKAVKLRGRQSRYNQMQNTT
eukprot:c18792_g2_i1.p1 GENE.c18792_g2_i1~~c18792_g2_i1.p1  ORF type:complete len:390 (+),score=137.78 c18792_g2_i1:23-1171(+)